MISDRSIRAARDQFQLVVTAADAMQFSRLQIVLDASLSMTSGDGSKEQIARELTILLLQLSESAGIRGSVYALRGADRNRTFETAENAKVATIPFDGTELLANCWARDVLLTSPNTMRVVISDFLFPGDPAPLVSQAADGAGRLWLVQLLDEWELQPVPSGPMALLDIETEQSTELMLDEATIARYVESLAKLRDQWTVASRSVSAQFVTASAAAGLERLCSDQLVPAGLLGTSSRN